MSGTFLPSRKVEDLFLCLGGILVHVGQRNLCMHLLYRSLILGKYLTNWVCICEQNIPEKCFDSLLEMFSYNNWI